jgi:hypothetical protein
MDVIELSQVVKINGKPATRNGKALTVGDVLAQALRGHTRQLPAYQAFVTLAKADLLARIEAGELELSQAERVLLMEVVGDVVVEPEILPQIYEVMG